jgi:cobalt-zinc-cadmium efflux system membrane fusion protein
MSATTILLVDDDAVLSELLRRALTRQGYHVIEASSVADGLRLAREQRPGLALVDLCLPDGDGVQLARGLAHDGQQMPLILMTAYPLRLRDQPELAEGFARILTKPLNLEEVRHTIEETLGASPTDVPSRTPQGPATPDGASSRDPRPAPAGDAATPPSPRRGKGLLWGVLIAAAIVIAGAVLGVRALHIPALAEWFRSSPPATAPPTSSPTPSGSIELAADVVKALGLKTVVVDRVAEPRPLVLAGSLSFDLNRLFRIQSRFGGEVIALGTHPTRENGETRDRPLRYGDHVHGPSGDRKGDLLAIVFSKDLGEKKSELVDSLVKLHIDEVTLKRYERMYDKGVLPEATLLQQQATVAQDRNAVARAERTLVTWRLPREEINAVKAEAQRIQDNQSLRDPEKETEWARVEVRAPADGVIVEKNVTVGNIVDTTFDLYKIADLRELGVIVHAYEEDLDPLRELTLPYPWEVRLGAEPRRPPLKGRGLEQIGKIVDPNQHTAPLMGHVDNSDRDLEVGQFVTATVLLPAPHDVVSLPASALDEDGDASVVFVQPDASHNIYQRRRVAVTQRLGTTVYVRSALSAEQQAKGLSPILPGERVVTQGVVELKAALAEAQRTR